MLSYCTTRLNDPVVFWVVLSVAVTVSGYVPGTEVGVRVTVADADLVVVGLRRGRDGRACRQAFHRCGSGVVAVRIDRPAG